MSTGVFHLPQPVNEPVRDYPPGSPERASLKARLDEMAGRQIEIPMVIGGEEVRTGRTADVVMPHDHQHVLGQYHQGGEEEVTRAIAAAADARREWAELSWEARAAVFLRAAELLAGPWRDTMNAATMLGQSKTAYQAEIDAACELADFWRYNVSYMHRLMSEQPISSPGIWNRIEYRALEGFVFAVAPFNFTAIAGNLPTAPAMMGNTVVFKPASTAVYAAHFLMKIYEEAGLPPGVINMVLGSGREIGDPVLAHPDLAGIHFTGSTAVFQGMWRSVAGNIDRYRTYPRLVGETGGKDFIFAHPSADPAAVVTAVVRGGFEYQGQKCSAASRIYAPSNLWPQMRDALAEQVSEIKMGDVRDFRKFMGAVIDKPSYETQKEAVGLATGATDASVVVGGDTDDSKGWFVSPTIVETSDPGFDLMRRELFGPVVTAYVYDEKRVDDTLDLVDATSPYALTGAVFATDRRAIEHAATALRNAAGNFYVNDKPTGAVVGQQPFGGARASGTNDKAGSMWNLIRWVSARTIKETFVPPTDYRYPFMGAE
jgi:1-pyrroline-5-carboxylate dehydrogenase